MTMVIPTWIVTNCSLDTEVAVGDGMGLLLGALTGSEVILEKSTMKVLDIEVTNYSYIYTCN